MTGVQTCALPIYEETDSTNIRARKLAEEGAPDGTLVVTDFQNAGRGRRGRMWVSPSGTGIFMSLILRPDILPSSASMLTLVAALAVYDGIKETTGLETVIKWPNDIVAEGKKLCGILTEMSAELEGIHYVVTGIGINANMTEFPEEVGGGSHLPAYPDRRPGAAQQADCRCDEGIRGIL